MSIFSLRTNTQVFIEDFKKVTKIKKLIISVIKQIYLNL